MTETQIGKSVDEALMNVRLQQDPHHTLLRVRDYLRSVQDWRASGLITLAIGACICGMDLNLEHVVYFLERNKPK